MSWTRPEWVSAQSWMPLGKPVPASLHQALEHLVSFAWPQLFCRVAGRVSQCRSRMQPFPGCSCTFLREHTQLWWSRACMHQIMTFCLGPCLSQTAYGVKVYCVAQRAFPWGGTRGCTWPGLQM